MFPSLLSGSDADGPVLTDTEQDHQHQNQTEEKETLSFIWKLKSKCPLNQIMNKAEQAVPIYTKTVQLFLHHLFVLLIICINLFSSSWTRQMK